MGIASPLRTNELSATILAPREEDRASMDFRLECLDEGIFSCMKEVNSFLNKLERLVHVDQRSAIFEHTENYSYADNEPYISRIEQSIAHLQQLNWSLMQLNIQFETIL